MFKKKQKEKSLTATERYNQIKDDKEFLEKYEKYDKIIKLIKENARFKMGDRVPESIHCYLSMEFGDYGFSCGSIFLTPFGEIIVDVFEKECYDLSVDSLVGNVGYWKLRKLLEKIMSDNIMETEHILRRTIKV